MISSRAIPADNGIRLTRVATGSLSGKYLRLEHDRFHLEQDEIAFLIGRILAERMIARCAGPFIARNEARRTS
jgi:hypothetical protein